jgi:hypothetical protein
VMAGPGTISDPGPFSLGALPRVIADAAELADHPWREPRLPEGVAIGQYDPMAPSSDTRVREFADRWGLEDTAVERLTAGFTSATDGQLKLVVRDGVELLYDLRADPGESAPLDPAVANGAVARLHAALAHPAVTARGAAAPAPPTAPGPVASAEELTALERQMRLLGYL